MLFNRTTKKKKKDTKQTKKQEKNISKHISNALDIEWDDEKKCFKDTDENYILMAKTTGTNLFGLKEQDQLIYINAFSYLFNANIGSGQIFSYEVPADVDMYIDDYNYLKSTLDIVGSEIDQMRFSILDNASNRLKDTAVTRELVDRVFVIILKDTDYNKLKKRINLVVRTISPYQRTKILKPEEMISIVYNYYNPENSIFIEKAYKSRYGVMDAIYPDYIGFYDKGFHQAVALNGNYCKTKWLSNIYKEPVMALLCYIATYPDVDFSLHWQPAPKDSIKRDLDKSVKALEKNFNKATEQSNRVQINKEMNQSLEMLDTLIQNDDFPIYFSASIRIKAETPEILDARCREIDDFAKQFNIRLREALHQPKEMFDLTAPICRNNVENYMMETTADTMGYLYPFVFEALYDRTAELDDEGEIKYHFPPIYIGNTINTNGVVFYDNFNRTDERTNSNEFIVGMAGMGKTLFIMWLIKQRYALGYRQYIIDVEGKELHKLTYSLGGENINCSNGTMGRINPLHIRFNIPDSEDNDSKVPLTHIYPLAEHIRFLRAFFNAYKGSAKDDIRLLHDNMIEKALETVYKRVGIDYHTNAQYIIDHYKNDDYPIMQDLYDELNTMLEKSQKEKIPDRSEITRLKECIAFIEPMAQGADASIFNGCTNINLENKLLNFNLAGLQDNTDNKVLKTQYFNVLSFVWTNILSNPLKERQQLYADEFSVIMDPRYLDIMMYFQTIERRIRKYWGGLTVATQQVSDVLKDSVKDQGEAIIEQSTYQFYFGLGVNGLEFFKSTNLIPNSEIEFVEFAKRGECYAKIGSQTAMRVQITLPEDELAWIERMKN